MHRRALRRSLRLAVVGGALGLGLTFVACSAGHPGGPAWPRPADPETDGGESLAPRQAGAVAAIEAAQDASPSGASPAATAGPLSAAAPATPAAPGAAAKPPASDAPAPQDPDLLTTEEIIIEIDD